MVELNEGAVRESISDTVDAVDGAVVIGGDEPPPKEGALELNLDESLTIADVTAVYRQVAEAFGSSSRMRLKADALEQVDGAGVQLLAAIMREATARQVEIGWSGVSDALREAAEQLGLEAVLHFDASA